MREQRTSLAAMLRARSVAVVGASPRPGSFGDQLLKELERGAWSGDVFPVNPKYERIGDRVCYPGLGEIGVEPDVVLLGVPNPALEEQLSAAAAVRARSAVIFASCHDETPSGEPTLIERLAAIALDADMAVCGGNCMGFLNVDHGLRCCGFPMPESLEAGPITFITHSGSAFSALVHNHRGLRFNLVVSAGGELVTTCAEYLDYCLDLDTTGVIALFLETVRDPGLFRDALEKAEQRNVPVVVLKVGRKEQSKELVEAHSGALAGDDLAYDALFETHGALRVHTLDEMADTLELLSAPRRARAGGLAAIHDSGGERAMLIDVASDVRIDFAPLALATRERLEAVLEPGLPAVNPLDAWGTGNDADSIYLECMRALLDDPEVAALAFCVDLTTEYDAAASYVSVAEQAFAATTKPMAVLGNLTSAIDYGDARRLRAAGVPVLEGTATGLAAFKHLLAYRDHQDRAAPSAFTPPPSSDRWRERLSSGAVFSEVDALALIGDYGVPVVRAMEAAGWEEALAAAEQIGYPVALKTAMPDVKHKSDARGVFLDLSGRDALRAAYAEIERRLGPRVTVADMASPGFELALGIVNDDQFGPLVIVGAGGVLIETIHDRRAALPPLDDGRARHLVDRLAVRSALDGTQGRPPADVKAVVAAVVALSRLAEDLGDLIGALDVNPLLAGPSGCVAVDALVIPPRPASP